MTVANSAALSLGTSDYTLESWVSPMGYRGLGGILSKSVDGSTGGFSLNLDGGFLNLKIGANNINTNSFVPSNTWSHIAVSRESSNNRIFVNGKLVSSNVNGADISGSNGNFRIASARTPTIASNMYIGYLAGTRVLKGTALYTANFSIPTSPPTEISNTSILCNYTNAGIYDSTMSNIFETVNDVQISNTVSKFNLGSLKFDGTGDYLASNPATTDMYTFRSGDFTIELWVYFNSVASVQCFYDSRPTSTQGSYPLIYLNSDSTIRYFVNSLDRITSSAISSLTWYHLAIARSGTSTKMFINGNQAGSTYTDSTNYANGTGRPWIGINAFNTTQGFNGYINDLRVTRGFARYTANSTPPTTAFPTQ